MVAMVRVLEMVETLATSQQFWGQGGRDQPAAREELLFFRPVRAERARRLVVTAELFAPLQGRAQIAQQSTRAMAVSMKFTQETVEPPRTPALMAAMAVPGLLNSAQVVLVRVPAEEEGEAILAGRAAMAVPRTLVLPVSVVSAT